MTQPPRRGLPPALTLLVVEANMIIALDVEDMLTRNGAVGVDIASNRSEAFGFLASRCYNAAIVDLKLAQADSLAIAMRLSELRIPFVFSSGYGEKAERPEGFPGIAMVGKPFSETYLMLRLAELLAGEGPR